MPSFAIPLAAATVFTAGGYAILRAERFADVIGDWLFTAFVLTVLVGGAGLAVQAAERHRPASQTVPDAVAAGRVGEQPGQAWAQLEIPMNGRNAALPRRFAEGRLFRFLAVRAEKIRQRREADDDDWLMLHLLGEAVAIAGPISTSTATNG